MSKNVSNPTLNARGNVHRPLPYSEPFQGSPWPAGPGSGAGALRSRSCQPGWHPPPRTHLPASSRRIFCISQIGSTPCSLNTLWALLLPQLWGTAAHSPFCLFHLSGPAQLKVCPFQGASPRALLPRAVAASCEVWQVSLFAWRPYLY